MKEYDLKAIISPEAIATADTYIVTLKRDGESFPESHRAYVVVSFKPKGGNIGIGCGCRGRSLTGAGR